MNDQDITETIADSLGETTYWEPGSWGESATAILAALRKQYAIVDHNELALLRDGVGVRPMTDVETNLMTQVIDLRRELAAANHAEATK